MQRVRAYLVEIARTCKCLRGCFSAALDNVLDGAAHGSRSTYLTLPCCHLTHQGIFDATGFMGGNKNHDGALEQPQVLGKVCMSADLGEVCCRKT